MEPQYVIQWIVFLLETTSSYCIEPRIPHIHILQPIGSYKLRLLTK